MVNVNITVSLKSVTCRKGHFYAVPYWMDSWMYQCPMCAQQNYETKESECHKRDRIIRSLKGALTKAKRREGAKR